MIVVGTWDWKIARSFIWFLSLFLFILPIIAGFFRIQTHSCAKCLNEVQQQSIFSYLDMDDEICSFKAGAFGLIVKRRSLLYSIVVLVMTALTMWVINAKTPHETAMSEAIARRNF